MTKNKPIKIKKEDTVVTEDAVVKEDTVVQEDTVVKEYVAEVKEEVVEVKKSDYDKLMKQLERNASDIELLYKASDKSRMAKAMGNGGEILIKQVKLWNWDNTGKIVIGTKLISNRSEVVLGKWVEDQSIVVVLEDGENFTVPYLEFVRKILNKLVADVISTTKTEDEKGVSVTILKVQLQNGKTLEINSSFVN